MDWLIKCKSLSTKWDFLYIRIRQTADNVDILKYGLLQDDHKSRGLFSALSRVLIKYQNTEYNQ